MFLNTVADSFGMESESLEALQRLVSQSSSDISPHDDALFVLEGAPMAHRFGGRMVGFHLAEENLFLLKSADEGNTRVNHQELAPGIVALLAPGGAFRDSHGSSLFHSELVRLKSSEDKHPLTLRVEDVSHYFSFPKRQALHQFNLEAKGGQLVGIMGGSGSGKSTMLGVLNGSVKPTFGRVTINGIDVHDPVAKTAGLIGHVPQDDVLLAELTVPRELGIQRKIELGQPHGRGTTRTGGRGAKSTWLVGDSTPQSRLGPRKGHFRGTAQAAEHRLGIASTSHGVVSG